MTLLEKFDGHFESEEDFVMFLKKALIDEKSKRILELLDLTIENVIDGHYDDYHRRALRWLFRRWNRVLGAERFTE